MNNRFAEIAAEYADTVAVNFQQHVEAQPEDQLKAPVGELIRKAGTVSGEIHWRTEVRADDVHGRPDLGITRDTLLVGHVELKRPGVGARPEGFAGRNREQWHRFKALPNLVYTDGSEWSLYRSGQRDRRVRIADDVSVGGAAGLCADNLADLDRLLIDFLNWDPIAPSSASGIAEFLAPLTRILRDDVRSALDNEGSSLAELATEWRGLLFPESGDEQFADAYAQTLTYAMLLARFEGAESLGPAHAADALANEHGLLAQAIQLLEVPPVREELRMPIELLERAIAAIDPEALKRRQGHQKGLAPQYGSDSDPWLYFYEDFLAAYDPKLRNNRGVYFTPLPVVRAQVRFTAELLKTRLNKPMAFASNDVYILDPACGTGTYPLAVIDNAAETVRDRFGAGAVPGKLRNLAERLHGFEILVGPYAVSHLRISQRFKETGVSGRTANVYLSDTLESPHRVPKFTASMMQQQITRDRERAQAIKKDTRILVCLGNPPYDRENRDPEEEVERRKGGWVRYGDEGPDVPSPILEDFLAPAREAGAGVHLKNLYNDYVYFWRWALWKVFDSTGDSGIVTFITASSYIRGPAFAGMRRKMREVFDELWIIDLEGDSLGARKTRNVFAIQTPVAIAIGIRSGAPKPNTPAKVWKSKLTGTDIEKLDALDNAESLDRLDWQECAMDWNAPLYPAGDGTYFDWPQLTDLFPWQHSGMQLKRAWPIGETRQVLEKRWQALLAADPEARAPLLRETRDRTVKRAYPKLLGEGKEPPLFSLMFDTPVPQISKYAFRAFDRQYLMIDARLGDFYRPALHRSHGTRQIFMTSLLKDVLGNGPAAVATSEIPDLHHFSGRGAKDVIPLWRDSNATQPNVTSALMDRLQREHGVSVSATDLFAYTYGVLAQPAYVQRFWDELEQPPLRLPVTKDGGLFRRVADHGARLLYLHTYGERYGQPNDHGTIPQGVARCSKAVSQEEYPKDFSYDPLSKTLRVGDGEFGTVAEEVWDFSVSGLQVVKSWLGYRKEERSGRKSSELDKIRPERWDFTEELLELLWVLESTIEMQPRGATLLAEVCASPLFSANDLPQPSAAERKPPVVG